MVSCCNRRLYKGNSYEICLPITDTGVTSVSFYTSGDMVIEKEGEIVDDMMCFELTKEELDLLPDGVLRYSYDGFDSNTEYVVATPGDYSGTTLEDIIADAFDSGYTAGQEDCSGDTCEGVFESGYTSGVTDGIAEQKSKLVPTAITENGTYTKEDGFSSVEVNVPTGQTINNQVKSYSIGHWQTTLMQTGEDKYMYTLINRPTILTYDSGYTGLEKLILNMGIDAYEAVDLGKILQRAKMVSTAITENGTYSREDGYSSIEVNIPQTGHTDQEMQDSWNSGYTSGYTDGLNACSGGNEDLIANLENDYFVIPEGTTKLRDYAFFASSLSSITIPSSVTEIGRGAFENTQLTGITIPSSIHTIMDLAFDSTRLEEIVVPDTVSTLGAHAFHFCNYLTAATLPSGLTAIPNYLFSNTSLTGITLPTGITSIGNYAFEKTHLTGNIVIPSGVTRIYIGAFEGCSGLTSMTFESPVPASITATSNTTASLGSSAYTWPIYVPCEAVEDYKTAWPYYAHRISCQQEPEPEPVYSAMPLTLDIISGGTMKWTYVDEHQGGQPVGPKTIEYQINDGEWTELTSSISGTSLIVNSGDVVKLRGNNSSYASGAECYSYTTFSGSTAVFNLKGNLLSLNSKTNYAGRTSIYSEWAFYSLFNATNVVDASNLVLQATGITSSCYEKLFANCTMLTHPPKVLPAPTVYGLSYWGMFDGCTNMVEAPEILATSINNVTDWSMCFMFHNCTSLTKAPDIMVSKLFYESCREMFAGCTNLNYIKCLATTIEQGACPGWVNGVAETGTFIKHPESTGWVASYIPSGWTVIDAQS